MEGKVRSICSCGQRAQLRTEDINQIMRQVLYEFPISEAEFYIPKWVEMLPKDTR